MAVSRLLDLELEEERKKAEAAYAAEEAAQPTSGEEQVAS